MKEVGAELGTRVHGREVPAEFSALHYQSIYIFVLHLFSIDVVKWHVKVCDARQT